jgi:pimeloyl-ACP methyl ester carboxylesterase
MEYVVHGEAPRSILFIPGGPGSAHPQGLLGRMVERQLRPYLAAGWQTWQVTRRRHMPAGHTVADMAADHADFIRDQLGGHVDLVVGESYGGMIALHVAADHADTVGLVVVVGAAARITQEGRDLDLRWARARADGRTEDAGSAMLEYMLRGPRLAGVRRVLGRAVGPLLFSRSACPAGDLLVEAEAEMAYDATDALPRIRVPVLMLSGDADMFFPRELLEETAGLVPDCELVLYPGLGHMRAVSSKRVPRDALAWAERRRTEYAGPGDAL